MSKLRELKDETKLWLQLNTDYRQVDLSKLDTKYQENGYSAVIYEAFVSFLIAAQDDLAKYKASTVYDIDISGLFVSENLADFLEIIKGFNKGALFSIEYYIKDALLVLITDDKDFIFRIGWDIDDGAKAKLVYIC